jgi:hypothetical protein
VKASPFFIASEHVAAKLNDFAENNMLQVNNLARIPFTWVISPKWNARQVGLGIVL